MTFIIKVKPRIERPEGRHRERRNKEGTYQEDETREETRKERVKLEEVVVFLSIKLLRLCWSAYT